MQRFFGSVLPLKPERVGSLLNDLQQASRVQLGWGRRANAGGDWRLNAQVAQESKTAFDQAAALVQWGAFVIKCVQQVDNQGGMSDRRVCSNSASI